MKYRFFLLLLFLWPSGCHSTPVAPSEAIPVADDRLYAFQVPSSERNASITVIRDEGIVASACYIMVHINSTEAARLDTGEIARFYVKPGTVLIRAGIDPEGGILCLDPGNWTQVEIIVGAGEGKRFRVSTSSGAKIYLTVLGGE